MGKLKLFILIFFFAILGPLAFVIYQTYAVLEREERSQLEFFAQTMVDQMQQDLSELVQQEENRAVDEYQQIIDDDAAGVTTPRQSPPGTVDAPSYILGYLQNNPDGSFQTPTALEDAEETGVLLSELRSINETFNQKKYNLPSPAQENRLDMNQTAETELEEVVKDESKGLFSERYLTKPKTAAAPQYLGKKQQRVEQISPQQALNVSREKQMSRKEAGTVAGSITDSSFAESADYGDYETTVAADKPAPQEISTSFEVEVAPFQSVSINDDQIYIFRRVAIENQIYRQGFIVRVKPLMEHLVRTHFTSQPLAQYTSILLKRTDLNSDETFLQAGASADSSNALLTRVFPAPFDFLDISVRATTIPPSPARSSLQMALFVFAIFFCVGLIVIYQNVRAIVELSENRSQFVSSVTHELKTPLTNIRMYIEMLEQGIATSPEREQEYLGILSSESIRLSNLINNVLELSRLEKKQRRFHLEVGDITDLLEEVQVIMQEKLRQEGFALSYDSSGAEPFGFDREVLMQILVNLIENSIKFGRSAPVKQIHIDAATLNNQAILSVSDTGAGIPKGDLTKVFDDFYRADNDLTRSTGGTGIGLALVKKFVRAMGGTVSAVNNKDAGCTITLSLPITPTKQV